MEVLISIFVILFALLSLAALVPIARFELAKANIADRSVICGHEALNALQLSRCVSFSSGPPASANFFPYCNPAARLVPNAALLRLLRHWSPPS